MLRVNSSDVLVVPPFECAWLADETDVLKSSSACVVFEAQGTNFESPGSAWENCSQAHLTRQIDLFRVSLHLCGVDWLNYQK